MPKIQSAKKALRQNIRRRERNLVRQKKTKDALKTFRVLITQGKKDEAVKQLHVAYKTLDKMAKVGFIKKNKANRLKSRLAKKLK